MIKFFRTIRRDLITKNKIGRYLAYAIGEIVLVVIGILIALSINNKNAELSDRRAEKNFYRNIRQQLLDDRENLESQQNYNSSFVDQFSYAIKLIDINARQEVDSLSKIMVNIANYSDFDRQGNIYQTIVNSGDIKLLRSKDIIERLRRLEETYLYVNRMETIHFDAVMELVPYMMDSIKLSTGTAEDEDFLFSYRSQNMFVTSLRIMGEKEEVYKRAIHEINQIIALIDVEISE